MTVHLVVDDDHWVCKSKSQKSLPANNFPTVTGDRTTRNEEDSRAVLTAMPLPN